MVEPIEPISDTTGPSPLLIGGGILAALAVIAATLVITTTPIRQVMAFLVGFILGTCFLLLRCY